MALKSRFGIAMPARLQTCPRLMENTTGLGRTNHRLKNVKSVVVATQDSRVKIEHLTHGWIRA